MDKTTKRAQADSVLQAKLTDEQKLFIMFQLHRDELNSQFPHLYYAFLEWKNLRLKELWSKEVDDFLEQLNQ